MVLINVARSDGTVDLATAEEIGPTCKTAQGDSSPAIFPGETKPFVHPSYIMNPEGWPTNMCGQISMGCGKSLGSINVYATFNNENLIYQSDTVTIDCLHLPSAPVVLTLKPIPVSAPPDDGSSAPVQY
jgi:hypothetical protein